MMDLVPLTCEDDLSCSFSSFAIKFDLTSGRKRCMFSATKLLRDIPYCEEHYIGSSCCCCVVVFQPFKVMLTQSVYLPTLFLCRLRPPTWLTSTKCSYFCL